MSQAPAAPPTAAAKRHAPATLRNREPLLNVLREVLPERGRVLEIAAGSGEHAIYFAGAFPGIVWRPTDADPRCVASIDAWAAGEGLANLRPAARLDVFADPCPTGADERLDAVICINMIHIAPWRACLGLMALSGASLKAGGALVLYGPFMMDGRHTAPSNAAFDADLKARDPRWGVRDIAGVAAEAAVHGLTLEKRIAMPANNFSLVFRAARPTGPA